MLTDTSNNRKEIPAYSMCYWRYVCHIVCKHYTRDPIECFDADHTGIRCAGWKADHNDVESRTGNDTPYTKAEPDKCIDCKYQANMRRDADDKESGGGGGSGRKAARSGA